MAGRRSPATASLLALLVSGAPSLAHAAPPTTPVGPPRESPLYGAPYRRGLGVEVAVGVALCQPSLAVVGSACGRRGGGPAMPGVGLRLGLGWRFDAHWQVSAAWARQGHRPGGSFASGQADAVLVAGRGIVPLRARGGGDSHVDLGFELGLGWSQRRLLRDAAPTELWSTGVAARPALILEGWVLADLAIGLELASQLDFHWRYCVDQRCETAPGPWMTGGLERRWVDGFTIAVRATGLLFPRL